MISFRRFGILNPAVLQLEVDLLEATNGDALILYRYNPDTGLWEAEQKLKVDCEKLEFKVSSF